MWSGRGEPLIVVNSGSAYGCVGLWVMDLRAVVPELRGLVERRTLALGGDSGRVVKRGAGEVGTGGVGMDEGAMWWKTPVVRFETLTEITRFQGRAEVEKNWMLWWPGDGRGEWVSYEMFGRWEEDGSGGDDDGSSDGGSHEGDQENSEELGNYQQQAEQQALHLPQSAWLPWAANNTSAVLQTTLSGSAADIVSSGIPQHTANAANSTLDLASSTLPTNSEPEGLANVTAATAEIIRQPVKKRLLSPTNTTHSTILGHPIQSSPTQSNNSIQPNSFRPNEPAQYTFRGGRSISQLSYGSHHLIALPNQTHPLEPPCLLPPDLPPLSAHKNRNTRKASTHQSTPALRLILCHRDNVSCTAQSPRERLESGREVHFSIVHRKLSPQNSLGLLERGGYERWVVVWEGRAP